MWPLTKLFQSMAVTFINFGFFNGVNGLNKDNKIVVWARIIQTTNDEYSCNFCHSYPEIEDYSFLAIADQLLTIFRAECNVTLVKEKDFVDVGFQCDNWQNNVYF